MAKIVIVDYDIFKLDSGVIVQVPHTFANLARSIAHQELLIKDQHPRASFSLKVQMIKYLRTTVKDSGAIILGLKDAKDIADHYYETCNQAT